MIAQLRQQGTPPQSPSPAASELPAPPKAAECGEAAELASKVFVTADMLAQRLAAGGQGGVLELACNEFLTPNAEDFVARRHMTIRKAPKPLATQRVEPSCSSPAIDQQPSAASQQETSEACLGVVVHRGNEKIEGLLRALKYDLPHLRDLSLNGCWMENVRAMCQQIAAGRLVAGVAILPYAADAMVLANKIDGILAVQGTRPASVAAAIRHFGANVLVCEHAFSTFHEMRQMIRIFATWREKLNADAARRVAISKVERRSTTCVSPE